MRTGRKQMALFLEKGRKEDRGNYGLVSLTLIPGKVTIRKEYFWKLFSKYEAENK